MPNLQTRPPFLLNYRLEKFLVGKVVGSQIKNRRIKKIKTKTFKKYFSPESLIKMIVTTFWKNIKKILL